MNTQKITIGIIKLNDISINLTKTNIKEQIENIIEDDFDIHTVKTPQEVYEYIYPLLSPNKDKEILQYNFYENKDFFYSGFFVESNNTKNIFGSEIMSKNVTSNLYIVKHKLKYESNISFEYTNFEFFEIIDILTSMYFHQGIKILEDGSLIPYNYTQNPLIHFENIQDYIFHEFEVYTKVMMVIVNTKSQNINKTGSILANMNVKGIIHVALYNKPEYNEEQAPYFNLSESMLKNIINIKKKGFHLTENYVLNENEYINFEKLLEVEKHKNN